MAVTLKNHTHGIFTKLPGNVIYTPEAVGQDELFVSIFKVNMKIHVYWWLLWGPHHGWPHGRYATT